MKIQLKRSNVLESGAAKKPTPAQMEYGELAVNYNKDDPSIFLKDSADGIVKVGGDLSLYQKIGEIGTAVFVCSPSEINVQSPLADRLEGTLWWNTEAGILYVWYEDADSSQWVIAVPQAGTGALPGTSVGPTPPADPNDGDLWFNSDDGRLYVWYVSETTGIVTGVSVRNGGSGYNSAGTDVSTNGGSGTGLTIDYQAGVGGTLVNPTVNSGGHSYNVGDVVFVTGSGHANGSISVTTVNSEPFGQWVDASPDSVSEASFLSSVNDDTAAGEITFEKKTTHEDGISVTGGSKTTTGNGIHKTGVDPLTLYSPDSNVTCLSESGTAALANADTGHRIAVLNDGRFVIGKTSNGSYALNFNPEPNGASNGMLVLLKIPATATGVVGLDVKPDASKVTGNLNYLRYVQAGNNVTYSGTKTGDVTGYFAHRNIGSAGTNAYGFYSEILGGTGSATNKYNFYAAGDAPNYFPVTRGATFSFLDISELDQTDSEGNTINWEQPTAATVGTGIYRNEAGALCFARNGECALEIGNGQAIGNLIDKLESIEARLSALEGGNN